MFSCNVVSRWAQVVSFLNCLQDAIYRDEFRRINCSWNWSFISYGELHCDSVKIKTMINSSLFFLRQCKSLDWGDCLIVLLLSATDFQKSSPARLIRGCFSFPQCFRAGVFSSLSLPPPRSLWLAPSPPLIGKFQHGPFASKLGAKRKRQASNSLIFSQLVYLFNQSLTSEFVIFLWFHAVDLVSARILD